MTCRAEKPGRSASDRRRSPRMRGPAAGGEGEASVPPAFAAIVRVESPPTSSFFPPRLPHLRHLRNLRFRNGRCSGGVPGFSLCLRAFVVKIWAKPPLRMPVSGRRLLPPPLKLRRHPSRRRPALQAGSVRQKARPCPDQPYAYDSRHAITDGLVPPSTSQA